MTVAVVGRALPLRCIHGDSWRTAPPLSYEADMKVLAKCALTWALLPVIACWQLTSIGLNESYRVLHLSQHFARLFLCISVRSNTFPTLIESSWPESSEKAVQSFVYPHHSLHASGDRRDCSRIHQAHWLQVDSLSRLWVLDVGWLGPDNYVCAPKLFAFDLLRDNIEILRIDCTKYMAAGSTPLHIVAMKLGPRPNPCTPERYLYFALAEDHHLLIYDILEQTWHRCQLLSHKYDNIDEPVQVHAVDLTFGQNAKIYIADTDGSLYSALVPMPREYDDRSHTVHVEHLGHLLGFSRSLLMDVRQNAIFYVVPKFGAVVHCVPKPNLTTEGNEVIYITSKNVQQIFFGLRGSIWLLNDRWLSPQHHCILT